MCYECGISECDNHDKVLLETERENQEVNASHVIDPFSWLPYRQEVHSVQHGSVAFSAVEPFLCSNRWGILDVRGAQLFFLASVEKNSVFFRLTFFNQNRCIEKVQCNNNPEEFGHYFVLQLLLERKSTEVGKLIEETEKNIKDLAENINQAKVKNTLT